MIVEGTVGMNSKIYVAMHKNAYCPSIPLYQPIQVGATLSQEYFLDVTDDKMDNISDKNNSYCELTALYWAWKNDKKSDIFGLCHYRRYFDFHDANNIFARQFTVNPSCTSEIEKHIAISSEDLENILSEYDIILPRRAYVKNTISKKFMTIEEHYISAHRISDWNAMKEVILRVHPEYKKTMENFLNQKHAFFLNMFVCKKQIFDAYMKWLFSILFLIERDVVLTGDMYQDRVFGFMGERLLNLFVMHNGLKIKEVPIVMLKDDVKGSKLNTRSLRDLMNW